MKVRQADTGDVERLNRLYLELDRLYVQALPDTFCLPKGSARPQEYLEKIIRGPNSIVFVAQEGEKIVGFVHAYVENSANISILVPRRFGVIQDLVVEEGFREKGIGKKLMDKAEEWILEKGASLIELNVWEFNTTAQRFYENRGFETISRKMRKRLDDQTILR